MTGGVLIPIECDWVTYIETAHVFLADRNGTCAAIDLYGSVVVPPMYSCIDHLGAHLYEVAKNSGRGVYDASVQRLVLPCEYARIEHLGADRCRVRRHDGAAPSQCGVFSTKDERFVVPVMFSYAYPLTTDLFHVSREPNLHGVYSTVHRGCIVPPRYASVCRLTDTLYLVRKDGDARSRFFLSDEQREWS